MDREDLSRMLLEELAEALADLPANLAIGCLADEEAAADEFRHWLHDLWQRLNRP